MEILFTRVQTNTLSNKQSGLMENLRDLILAVSVEDEAL